MLRYERAIIPIRGHAVCFLIRQLKTEGPFPPERLERVGIACRQFAHSGASAHESHDGGSQKTRNGDSDIPPPWTAQSPRDAQARGRSEEREQRPESREGDGLRVGGKRPIHPEPQFPGLEPSHNFPMEVLRTAHNALPLASWSSEVSRAIFAIPMGNW